MDEARVREAVELLLAEVGEDPTREGLVRTPQRYARAMEFLTSGYETNLGEIVNEALFTVDSNEMVIVRDIDFYSLCEHHLLPFFGRCHVAYLPRGRVIGLSKIPRLIEMFSRRLQLQERLTSQVASSLADVLDPLGVGVVVEATHLCIRMRGVEKQNAFAVTSAMLGSFRDDARTRMEFLELIGRRDGFQAVTHAVSPPAGFEPPR